MIRPRGGDFCYTDSEVDQMAEEIRFARACGADGVVLGLLTPDGDVDRQRTEALVKAADGMEVTFHRAFDMARDPFAALDAVVACGCRRILTSGGCNTAVEGACNTPRTGCPGCGTYRDHGRQRRECLECPPAGRGGADALHFSARGWRESRMRFRNPRVSMGGGRNPRIRRSVCRRDACTTDSQRTRTMIRWLILLLSLGLCACGGSRYGSGIPAYYDPLLDAALAECPRADSLQQLLRETPRAEREAMAWLMAWMPCGDLDTMRLDLLRENVTYACRARAQFPWAQTLPDSIFLNEVLPYAAVDEVRDAWRGDFYARFAPCVAGCRTLREAAEAVNRSIVERVGGVQYAAREDQPEPRGVDASAHGLLYGTFGAAGRCPAVGGHSGTVRRNPGLARRPGQPQLDGGVVRRRMALHGVLFFRDSTGRGSWPMPGEPR